MVSVLLHGLQQLVFGKGFGQVLLRPDHATARLVKDAILGRQHHNRYTRKLGVSFDDCASLVAVKTRHQDVTKNEMRLVVIDLGQCIESVLSKDDLMSALLEKNLSATPNGVAVVNHQYFESRSSGIHKKLLPN